MITNKRPQGGIVVIVSIVLASLLMLILLPKNLQLFRPELVVLTLIYWVMAVPDRVGLRFGWFVGLFMDLMTGGVLGFFAFMYAFMVYFVLKFHLQLRQYPLWQQALIIFTLIVLMQLVSIFMFSPNMDWGFYYPAVTSMFFWPIIYRVLRSVRRAFNVS